MNRLAVLVAMVGVLLLADSCSYRRMAYLQDMEELTTYNVTEAPEVKIRKNDKIKILVSCTNPVLAAPFNLVSGDVDVDMSSGTVNTKNTTSGVEYLVDKEGNFMFPVLGQIHAEGKTISELKDEITDQITSKNYIKDPIVTVEFSNFQITVLGEVASKGNYIVNDSKISILQAIALAGDLTTSAQTDNVWVIRTEGKKREVYPIDLRSKSCFDSPAFYLQQDDVVYVKPRKSKLGEGGQLGLQLSSILLSSISTIATVMYWVTAALRK